MMREGMLRTPAIIAFLFCAALLPLAAQGQNENAVASSHTSSIESFALPSIPGWYVATPGLLSNTDGAWIIGSFARDGWREKTLQQWVEHWVRPADPDARRLPDLRDANGRLYVVYDLAGREGYSKREVMAFADSGDGFIRIALSALYNDTFERNLPIFLQTVGRVGEPP